MSVGISKTRCLFVLPDLSGGGAEKVTLTLLKQLDRNRFEPSLLLFRQTGPFLAEVPADIPLAAALPGQHKGMLDSLAILLAIKRAARGADVVIGSLELQGIFFAVIGAALARRPSIAWVHKHLGYYLAHKPALARSVYWLVCALVFSLATRVVTVCAESADSIGRLFRWRRRVIGYHYNPVDFAEIDRLTTVEAGSAAVRDVRQILAVGRLTPQKGFDLLLQAMSLVVKQMPDARLCILGEGELRPGLEALRQRLGLSEYVQMPGFTMPYAAMSQAGIFVMSSRYEGLPTAMLEAMYCGAAIVSASCPSGPREILAEGQYGVLVAPEDPQELASALLTLLGQPERIRQLGEDARRRVADFAPARICTEWQQEILDVAGSRAL